LKSKKYPIPHDEVFKTLEEAIQDKELYLANNTLKKHRQNQKMGFVDFCDYYLNWYRTKPKKPGEGTIRFVKKELGTLKIAIGNVDIKEMDSVFISNIIDKESKREKRGNGKQQGGVISSNTLHHEYIMLGTLVKKMYKWGFINYNPMEELEPPKIETKPIEVPEFEERFEIEALFMKQPIRECLQFLLGLWCGLREEEVAGLHIDRDIEIKSLTLHINSVVIQDEFGNWIESPTPKSKAGARDIPLPEKFVPLFVKYLKYRDGIIKIIKSNNPDYKEIPNLFLNQYGGLCRTRLIGKNYRKLVKKTDINIPTTFHKLRHYFITNQVNHNDNLTIREIQELVGHADMRTTQNYTHASKKKILQNATKIFENFSKDTLYKNGKNILTVPIDHVASIVLGNADFSNINDLKITLEEISNEKIDFFNISSSIEYCRNFIEKALPSLKRIEKFKYTKIPKDTILKNLNSQFGKEIQIDLEYVKN